LIQSQRERMKTTAGVLARIARETAKINPAGFRIGFGLRCVAGVAIPLVAGLATGNALLGLAAAIGALPVGFASRQGVYRTRAVAMLLTALGMGLSAFVGSVTGGHAILSVAAAGLWGFVFGLLACLGPVATGVGLNSCLALAIFSQFQYSPAHAALQASLVVAGGVVQTLLLVLVWPLQRFAAERRELAKAYRALAAYAAKLSEDGLEPPGSVAFTSLNATLADPQPFSRRSATAAFEVLLDEAERIRGTFGALAVDRHILASRDRTRARNAIRALGAAAHNILVEIAASLEAARAPDEAEPWHAVEEAMARVERQAGPRTIADAQALLGQLRAAWQVASVPERGVAPSELHAAQPRLFAPFSESLRTLRANLSPTSEYAQHALRLGVTLMVASTAARAFTVERGYWAVLTAALVLRPDFATTFSRGVARIAGTLIGALIAAAVVAVFHPGVVTYLALALVFAGASFVVFDASYAAFTIAITGYVVFVLAYGGLPEQRALLDRVEATLAGGAIALGAYALWPTWERSFAPLRLAELLERQRTYFERLFRALRDPDALDAPAIHDAQLGVWLARSNAEASVDRLLAEPVAPKELTVRAGLGILAASRRLGLASLAINARLTSLPTAAFQAELDALAGAILESLVLLASALRRRSDPPELPPLRALHGALVTAAGLRGGGAGIVSETDMMVDALNTIYYLLHRLYDAEASVTDAGAVAP
jgi:uncharacterized membrane protein YccC